MIKLEDGYGLGLHELKLNQFLGFGHEGAIDEYRSLLLYLPKIDTIITVLIYNFLSDPMFICKQALEMQNILKA